MNTEKGKEITAIRAAIIMINSLRDKTDQRSQSHEVYKAISEFLSSLLAKERNNIEVAYNQGDSDRDNQQDGNGRDFKNCIDYYDTHYS